MSREKVISLDSVDYEASTGVVRNIYDTATERLGMVPNMYANMANVPALLDTYTQSYQRFRDEGDFSPVEQEVIFLAISKANQCEYCVGAHSMIADKMSGVPADVLAAIRTGEVVPDDKLAALNQFTQAMVKTRGNPSEDNIASFKAAGYSDKDMLSIILAISVKVLSNYSNHLFATPLDDAFGAYSWPE